MLTEEDVSGDALFQFDPDDPHFKGKTVASVASTELDSQPVSLSGDIHVPLNHPYDTTVPSLSLISPSAQSDPVPDSDLAHLDKGKCKALPPSLDPIEPRAFYPIPSSASMSTAGPSSSYGSSTFLSSPSMSPESIHSSLAPLTAHTSSLHRPHSLSNLSTIRSSVIAPETAAPTAVPASPRSLLNIKSRLPHSHSQFRSLTAKLISPQRHAVSAPSSPVASHELFQRFHSEDDVIFSKRSEILPTHSRSYSYPEQPLELYCTLTLDGLGEYNLLGRNLFNELLPRELQLRIFAALVALHVADHQRSIDMGKWTTSKASSAKNRWVGRDRGFRELIKLSRVCRMWKDIVFDGQLWSTVDLRNFPNLSPRVIQALMHGASSFVKQVTLSGNSTLTEDDFMTITDSLALTRGLPGTQLTVVNLQGCSGLTSRALHFLLLKCPSLLDLNLKGQDAVKNVTCEIIASSCPDIETLNLSRCHNLDAAGLELLAKRTLARGDVLALKKLYASGVSDLTDRVMASLGRATPHLEVLDLSYCESLHNSAVEAFVSVSGSLAEYYGGPVVSLTARQVGREMRNASYKYVRRVTKIRHLNLSCCVMLTDIACANLAYSVPHLEMLELAGIGDELEDGGLILLLQTTPLIRRLDLEDCSSITDDVVRFLTPSNSEDGGSEEGQTGSKLEALVLSYANQVSDEAIMGLIRGCPNLKWLEADNTTISGRSVKEFIKTVRSRDASDARIMVSDCRGVGETLVKEMAATTRGRLGWVGYEARKLKYVDGRDAGAAADLKIGQDECDEKKVVLKSFHSWQMVDAVTRAREKRRRKRAASGIVDGSEGEEGEGSGLKPRWWMRKRIRGSHELNAEGCLIM